MPRPITSGRRVVPTGRPQIRAKPVKMGKVEVLAAKA